jgi:trypsin
LGVPLAVAAILLWVFAMVAPGANAQPRDPKVIGGNTTTIEEWPWQAAILESQAETPGTQNGFQRQFCGGTLVTPTTVITAAHCAFDLFDGGNDFDDPGHFRVVTGRTTLSNEGQGQELGVSSLWFPTSGGQPLYNENTSEWDAVVMVLASPSSAGTIKIAGADETALWEAGRDAWATGWGATALAGPGSGGSDTLREVQTHFVSDSSCSLSYPGEFVAETMVCAGEPTGGKDTCFGDSGGPLMAPIAGGGFRLVGDTSWGNQCALPNQPGVYGRLAADPMRTAFRDGILGLTGIDVVGSGATPPASESAADTNPPNTKITKHPRKHVHGDEEKVRVTFKFTSDEKGSHFRCRLDKRPLKSCSSPRRYKVGTPEDARKHVFKVRAIDAAGNSDSSPAKFKFKASD